MPTRLVDLNLDIIVVAAMLIWNGPETVTTMWTHEDVDRCRDNGRPAGPTQSWEPRQTTQLELGDDGSSNSSSLAPRAEIGNGELDETPP
jgi:hypothetical protein